MNLWLSKMIDRASGFFASRKGLLPLIGILLVVLNFIFQLTVTGWVVDSNLFLHLGVVLAIFGLMLAWAL